MGSGNEVTQVSYQYLYFAEDPPPPTALLAHALAPNSYSANRMSPASIGFALDSSCSRLLIYSGVKVPVSNLTIEPIPPRYTGELTLLGLQTHGSDRAVGKSFGCVGT